jgi:predicted dehydrogenase
MKPLQVAIVGAGNIGRLRAETINRSPHSQVRVVADVDPERAVNLANVAKARATTDCDDAVRDPNIDLVVVSTPTKFHADASRKALSAGKHVLCEKPLARSVNEAISMISAAQSGDRLLKTGFNYRHMAHVRKAKELIAAGALGPVYFLRCRYGHGGRPGYEKDWCTSHELSGGGVLLEQGIHVIDLIRFLLGEPTEILADTHCFFWNFDEVEDNCFLLMRTSDSQTAQVHVSWTQWINILSLEIFGRDGYLFLTGRDRHYGPQRLVWGKRQPDHGRPEEEVYDFEPPDDSWVREWDEFVSAVKDRRVPLGSASDGLRALQIVEAAYESSRSHNWVKV